MHIIWTSVVYRIFSVAILTSYVAYECISSPSDTLQYLSQLESVARKLKDQLIRQNQVILRIKVMRFSFVMA